MRIKMNFGSQLFWSAVADLYIASAAAIIAKRKVQSAWMISKTIGAMPVEERKSNDKLVRTSA